MEMNLIDPDWLTKVRTEKAAAKVLSKSGALVAHRALRSFFDAQLVVADRLVHHDPRDKIEQDAFLTECMGYGRQMLLQGRLHAPEAVSRELFATAMRQAANRDILDPGRDEVAAGRQAWYDEVCDVIDRLKTVEQLDSALLEEVIEAHG
jgi:glycerol-3-phosphate O-acyltransferase